ncbi:rhodanese-related sulfurtransferase [Phytomonospora endophytica]|uniref:Rhodanese-related sulfurtransferase n=1 Tax=Phytomonospora endophytica TaxID=714109 RepID=A0A841FQL0_9ACTN|nr:rhodanese-related sulfurtransferase [Phytomonospora endophytica]
MTSAPEGSRGIDQILAEARSRLRRLGPHETAVAHRNGAVLVDIRPRAQRAAEGEIPGVLVVERNVLEWRFDPRGEARLPIAAFDLRVVVFCQEGYTSSLAAAALLDLGLSGATDLAGGFAAWRAAGLPTATTVSVTVDQTADQAAELRRSDART